MFGEIANKQYGEDNNGVANQCYYDLDGLNQGHAPANTFTYQSLLHTLKMNEIGWLAWSWGPDGCAPRNIAQYDPVTGQYAGLSQPYGDDIVNNLDYGLKHSAVRSPVL